MNPSGYPQTPPPPETSEQPVRVSVPKARPVITYGMMGLTIIVFLLQNVSLNTFGRDLLVLYGAKIDAFILQGQYWRLITPIFLHASVVHILFNMYALYALGPGLERQYGHLRFLALYLLGGFAGNVISFFFSRDPLTASIGSSTAIFGLLGAEGVFIYQNRRLFGDRARQILGNIIFIGAVNLVLGLAPGSQIDNLGHVGGLVGGLLFAWFAGPVLRVEGLAPSFHLVDERQSIQVQVAALGDAALFAAIALLKILTRG